IDNGWSVLTGWPRQEVVTKPLADFVHSSDRPAVLEALQSLLRQEARSCRIPARCRRRDGVHCWVEIHAHPSPDEGGEVQGVYGTLVDISNRRKGGRALRESEARFRAICEASPLGVYVTDANGNCIFANANFQHISGVRADRVRGRGYLSTVHPHDLTRLREAADDGHRTRAPYRTEHRYLHPDASETWSRINAAPILDGDNFLGTVHVVEDITERKSMEARQVEFMATLSHELRTPLSSVLGALEVLRDEHRAHIPENARRFLDMALCNGGQLAGLINSVLDLERIETGLHDFDFRNVEVAALLERAVQANAAYAMKLGVTIEVDRPQASATAWTDAERMLQILTNLISNAVKFSPPGAHVTLGSEPDRDKVRLFVRDQGPGIPEVSHARIFQRFGHACNQEHARMPGSGLGLSICKALALRLGGNIGFRSVVGHGSVFWIDIPRGKRNLTHARKMRLSSAAEDQRVHWQQADG
ncbi:MAG: PAS domain S-box protein, partial [Burkholderiales bacterium]|nr:PAS domain S-box protein [Burkholderiales bacterium]